jgi:hypothetical protein
MDSVKTIWQADIDNGAWTVKVSTLPEMPTHARHQILDRDGNILCDVYVELYLNVKDNIDSWTSMALAFLDA